MKEGKKNMNQNLRFSILKKHLESWEKFEKQYKDDFSKGFVAGAIESLKRAIEEILEEESHD